MRRRWSICGSRTRPAEQIALVEAYCKEQMLFRTDQTPEPQFNGTLELDLASVEPTVAGPKRPQDRVALRNAKSIFCEGDGRVAAAGDACGGEE